MSEGEAQRAPVLWDAPNQQVVRPDHSGPGTPPEGTGGSTGPQAQQLILDDMTKAQLLEYAQELGISPANAAMSKEEIRAGIDAYQAAE